MGEISELTGARIGRLMNCVREWVGEVMNMASTCLGLRVGESVEVGRGRFQRNRTLFGLDLLGDFWVPVASLLLPSRVDDRP